MQNIIPDERYSVADEAILGAFFKLLKEKKPDRITVSDITKTAGIARSTFYNHYQDIPSLISAVEDKTIHDVFSMMENFQPKNDRDICNSYFLTLCRYTMENPFLSGLLSTPHGNDLFEKMLTMLHHYVTETTSNSRPARHFWMNITKISQPIAVSQDWLYAKIRLSAILQRKSGDRMS